MATYYDLFLFSQDERLLGRISAAIAIQADIIKEESPATANHAERVAWAKNAFLNPEAEARRMIWALLAQYRTQDSATILNATDAQILTAVGNVLPLLY